LHTLDKDDNHSIHNITEVGQVIGVKDAATQLGVSQKTIYQWIDEGRITSHKLGNDIYLEQADIQKLLDKGGTSSATVEIRDSIVEMLSAGGIFYNVEGMTKQEVLHNALSLIKGMDTPEMAPILQMFLAREDLYSTGVGNGIAIPHASGTLVGYVNQPLISLSFLKHPIDYGSLDGIPVHILFSIISPNVRTHLRILAKLACVLHDPYCKKVIISEASEQTIFDVFRETEARICRESQG